MRPLCTIACLCARPARKGSHFHAAAAAYAAVTVTVPCGQQKRCRLDTIRKVDFHLVSEDTKNGIGTSVLR